MMYPNPQPVSVTDDLRELFAKLSGPRPTVADDLSEGLAEINDSLECALGNVGYITDVVRSERARRLARRRGVAIAADTAAVLDTLEWVLGEALDQHYELTGALGVLTGAAALQPDALRP